MPELPEIEVTKRSLFKKINKTKIIDIKIYNKNLRYKITQTFYKNIINQKILNISRRSKYLIFHLKKKILLAHFGMSGKILLIKSSDKQIYKTSFYYDLNFIPKHNHIYFTLNNDFTMVYNDIRRFGFFKIYNTTQINNISFLKSLGPEPLSKKFNIKYFSKCIRRKKNIKNLLMDQTFVSGLGNIYVNEVLFMSKISPLKLCNILNETDIKKLIFNIKKILKISIHKGGSSIKDYRNALGKTGSFQQFFRVYGQENKNCSRISCKGKIKKILICNRSSFYCNKCQN
jgi:formamidopyrimidine-DNA glycosylase